MSLSVSDLAQIHLVLLDRDALSIASRQREATSRLRPSWRYCQAYLKPFASLTNLAFWLLSSVINEASHWAGTLSKTCKLFTNICSKDLQNPARIWMRFITAHTIGTSAIAGSRRPVCFSRRFATFL